MFLSFDGGGSKMNALMFDDDMNVVSAASVSGVNPTQSTREDCLNNIRECVRSLFEGHTAPVIERMYSTVIGSAEWVLDAVRQYAEVKQVIQMTEGYSAMLAGGLVRDGLSIVCGTGATVGYVRDAKQLSVGGWGPVLGDDGSGTWMGQMAIRAVVRMINGWGESTKLYDFIKAQWALEKDWDMVTKVHSSPAPLRVVASLTRAIGQAADAGDRTAISILEEAARLLAVQTAACIKKYDVPLEYRHAVMTGGAWKTHPLLPELYKQKLAELEPSCRASRSLFEQVIAGPAGELLLEKRFTRSDAFSLLDSKMHQYRINGSKYFEY